MGHVEKVPVRSRKLPMVSITIRQRLIVFKFVIYIKLLFFSNVSFIDVFKHLKNDQKNEHFLTFVTKNGPILYASVLGCMEWCENKILANGNLTPFKCFKLKKKKNF